MQTMKRIIMVCMISFLTFCCLFGQAQKENEKKVISKIKVYLDDEELTLENADDGKIKLSTILSFTKFKTGKAFSESALEKEITQTELRLIKSGLFYNVKVDKMASRKNPGTYVIYITVTTGFLKRFGGGGIYAQFGRVALDGNRNQLMGFAGWNKNGASFIDDNCLGVPFVLGGGLFTNMPDAFIDSKGIRLNGNLTLGAMLTPEIRLCVDTYAGFLFKDSAVSKSLVLSPYISETKYVSSKFFWTSEVRVNLNPLLDWSANVDSAFTVNYTPFKQLTLAGLIAGGYCFGESSDTIVLLRSCEKPSYNLGLCNKEIRSGYSKEQLAVKDYFMTSAEIRWNAVNFSIPPCFPVHLVPYIFTDVAWSQKTAQGNAVFNEVLDAYGLGLYLVFDSPVFATFNFSYGFNHEGKGRFCFAAMQSF